MNLRQMQYLYMYGTKSQIDTVKILADMAVEQIDMTKQKDLIELIRWVMDYKESGSYTVFFMEFCMSVEDNKQDFEFSTMEAIKMLEEFYGKVE